MPLKQLAKEMIYLMVLVYQPGCEDQASNTVLTKVVFIFHSKIYKVQFVH